MVTCLKYIGGLIGLLSLFVIGGCESDIDRVVSSGGDDLAVRIAPSRLLGGIASEQEAKISRLDVYRFEGDELRESISGLLPDESGVYTVRPTERVGRLYFLANASGVQGLEAIGSLDDFLSKRVSGAEMTGLGLLMTGQLDLDQEAGGDNWVSMCRSVARLDVDATASGVRVSRILVKNVATSGYAWSREAVDPDAEAGMENREYIYQEPLSRASTPVCYLYEQNNKALSVEIFFSSGDGDHRLEAALPVVKRNMVYTLRLLGSGADFRVEVLTADWDGGGHSDAELEARGLIDVAASELGDSVRVSEGLDTLYVPYKAADFRLVLATLSGSEVVVSGYADGAQVSKEQVSKGLDQKMAFRVRSEYRMPGYEPEYLRLEVVRSGLLVGRVTLVFLSNPIQLDSDRIRFDKSGTYDFGTYADGDFGVLTLPEGKTASLEFDDPSSPWARLVQLDGAANRYRIQGGWRPNDPEADGRIQRVRLRIAGQDGVITDEFTLKRRNYGLPVVNINGTWWCKYNLRGHVKDFEDQIGVLEDPVKDTSALADYLKTCPEETLLALMGDQYQAGNPEGLRLARNEEGLYYYEGMRDQVSDFGTIAPTEMAPSGYQVPDYDDLRAFTWSNNSNMGYGSNWFNNNLEGDRLLRFQYFIVERENVVWLDEDYGSVMFYDFRLNGGSESLVFFGLGHQWNTTAGNVSRTSILFATYGKANSTWQIEGYAQSENKGNWYKYASHNAVKTRTIRCVKSPVDYIY